MAEGILLKQASPVPGRISLARNIMVSWGHDYNKEKGSQVPIITRAETYWVGLMMDVMSWDQVMS